MDDLLFALKRAHLAGNRWALGLLAKLGVTPARFDLMQMMYVRHDYSMPQDVVRARLGVARSTVSRMLRALERLGWVERKVDPFDARKRWCTLTYAGRSLVWRVLSSLVRTRVVADAIDAALGGGASAANGRVGAESLCFGIVRAFARVPGVLTVRLDGS